MGPYGIITRLSEWQQADMESGLMPGSAYMMGLRLSPLTTNSGTAAQIELLDNEQMVWGSGSDISAKFDATNLVFAGATERVGKVVFDNIEVNIGEFHSTTQGSGVPLSSTYTAAFRVHVDDDGTASAAGSVPDIAAGKFRYLHTVANSNPLRHYGVMGQVKAYDADWDNEQVAGVYGYLELVRNAATLSFGSYGVSAGVMGCVETAGNMTVDTNHILAGLAAINKLSYSGTLTQTGKSAGVYVGMYDATNWSDSSGSYDKWSYGLFIQGSSASDGVVVGTSAVPVTLATYANRGLTMYTTCASTDGSNSVESMYVKSTLTGAAGVGGRARFHTYANVGLGGWANALKGYMEFGASGSVTGIGSGVLGEVVLSAGTSGGTYAGLESEIVVGSSASCGTATSFLYGNISGADAATTGNLGTYLFELGTGVADTANGLFEAEVVASLASTHKIRCRIAGTTYYIPLNTAKDA